MPLATASLAHGPVPCDWLIVPIIENAEYDRTIAAVDVALEGRLARLREAGDLTGGHAEMAELRELGDHPTRRVLLVGLGEAEKLTAVRYENALMTAIRRISTKQVDHAAVLLPQLPGSAVEPELAARIAAMSLVVGPVGQGLYKSKPDRFRFAKASVVVAGQPVSEGIARAVAEGEILGESVNLTRELVNRQPDDIYPEAFADRASQLAVETGLDCDILDERRLTEERMGALLAVGKGSVKPPRMVVLTHRGGAADGPMLALVGKGVTFDSGGLSLKPNDGMKTMKCDMAGGATVLGAMVAIARLKLPVNVMGLVGLVENMPSGSSFKLGDVLTARNGITIEVMNTDAEGRLVLADVLSYAVDQKVAKIVDLATLTGACVVALGEEVAGGFTNQQPWYDAVAAASRAAGEDIWQLPMFDFYADQLKCDVADVKNVGTRWGGAITAAKFLEKFVAETPWVHLDIAGPAFMESNRPHREGGATGAYTRTLIELARNFQ
ncbi:Cytosol aminopeptidase [Caulifigura coniformis]|uniref:Probable cytosol aminopeptidase n=1 Tax=Caulifigura coniformis TaxID=2527983 RepID=A0A517SK65_9PLAN|nr:leucyl aminopeptidase [Caulifigura coniformis]QDT56512.1 Cytosol aminopeptidase [Caulifigura coniformis]